MSKIYIMSKGKNKRLINKKEIELLKED